MNSEKLSSRAQSRSVVLCALLGAFLLGVAGLSIPSSALAKKPGTECENGMCEPGENASKCPMDCGEEGEVGEVAEYNADIDGAVSGGSFVFDDEGDPVDTPWTQCNQRGESVLTVLTATVI